MKSKHTKAHMRRVWQPSVMDRRPWEDWVSHGRTAAPDLARQRARQILTSHEPEPLPGADRIREIITEYERRVIPYDKEMVQ